VLGQYEYEPLDGLFASLPCMGERLKLQTGDSQYGNEGTPGYGKLSNWSDVVSGWPSFM
jgi:hypothetical protein